MVDFKYDIVRNMKQRVRTPQFLNRVINVYDFTTLFSRLMMYRRAKIMYLIELLDDECNFYTCQAVVVRLRDMVCEWVS